MFPKSVQPYPQQVELAKTLKESKQVLIFESPTGTGKTCSLLSGAIQWLDVKLSCTLGDNSDLPAWLKEQASALASQGDFILAAAPLRKKLKMDEGVFDWLNQFPLSVPKIYYVSRTHSQLSQALKELLRFNRPDVSATIQASRSHLCINDKVRHLKGEALNEKCHELVDQAKCPYFNPQLSTAQLSSSLDSLKPITDIEDLVSLGRAKCTCPYYLNKAQMKKARFIFLPYPSMLIPQIRKGLDLYLKDSLIVFDEAHNLPDAINSMNSYSIALADIKEFHEKILAYIQRYGVRMNPRNTNKIKLVAEQLKSFLGFLQNAPKEFTSIDYFSIHSNAEVDFIELATFVQDYRLPLKCGLSDNSDFSTLLSSLSRKSSSGKFLLDSENLQYISFDPSEAFEDILMETNALVFAGGTIGSLQDFAAQLLPSGTSFHTKSFGHLIKPEQLRILPLSSGPTGKSFRFNFENRTNLEMYHELAACLRNLEKIIPGGIALFFPSYQSLGTFKNLNLGLSRPFFCENQNNTNENVFDSYKREIDKGKWATLASVIGGKLSEGINFSDNYARAVLIIGLPYPNIQQDRATQLRIDFLSRKLKTSQSAVLENQCMRTVNQALGRAIRHINDYAVAILVDERYSQKSLNVPQWMQPSVDSERSLPYGKCHQKIVSFFRQIKK